MAIHFHKLGELLPFTRKPAPCMSGDGDMVTGLPGKTKETAVKFVKQSNHAGDAKYVEVQRSIRSHEVDV